MRVGVELMMTNISVANLRSGHRRARMAREYSWPPRMRALVKMQRGQAMLSVDDEEFRPAAAVGRRCCRR
jgi:hypothetical protein